MNIWRENIINNAFFGDLKLHRSGLRKHSVNHSYPPYRMDYYLINYISEGAADFVVGDKVMTFKAHQLYVMFPNSGISYRTHKDVPWTIHWIIVSGEQISRFLSELNITHQNPMIEIKNPKAMEDLFDDIFTHSQGANYGDSIKCMELVYKLFRKLLEQAHSKSYSKYVSLATDYIQLHFNKKITAKDVASHVNLNSNYFSKLFKSEVGMTPTDAINQLKIDRAKYLLENTHYPIGDIASLLGFSDQLYFSKLFSKVVGIPPKIYRKLNDI